MYTLMDREPTNIQQLFAKVWQGPTVAVSTLTVSPPSPGDGCTSRPLVEGRFKKK